LMASFIPLSSIAFPRGSANMQTGST
jgi:hypothetical protein